MTVAASHTVICGQQPQTADLLTRTAGYVQQFVTQFSNVVAEEQYVQRVGGRTRRLRSDFHLVMFPGATEWLQFRHVVEVDGKPVDEEVHQQVARLFLEPPANATRRAREIAETSARYNIVNIGTSNTPVLALSFLQAPYQRRFRFVQGPLDTSVGPSIRVVRYEETARPTILRSGSLNDMPARGRFWVDESTGVVVKTELQVGSTRSPTESITTFAFDDGLKIYVPTEMRDRYPQAGPSEMTGVATYGRFRRFQVQTEAEIEKP